MRHSQQGGRSRSSSSSSRSQGSRGGQESRIASEGGRARWGYRDSAQDDRSYSARDQDYDNYRDYDDIEDEGYERGGYGRSSGRGGIGRGYNLSDRDYDRDFNRNYDEDEGYHEENVRGRRGFAAMDPEEQREISAMGGRASHGGRTGTSRSRSGSDEDHGYEDERESRGRQSQTSNRSRSTSSRSARH